MCAICDDVTHAFSRIDEIFFGQWEVRASPDSQDTLHAWLPCRPALVKKLGLDRDFAKLDCVSQVKIWHAAAEEFTLFVVQVTDHGDGTMGLKSNSVWARDAAKQITDTYALKGSALG